MKVSSAEDGSLRRSIGLAQLTLYGTGTILGAGIFVVVGEVAGEAGALAPVAYLLAALVAALTALSYAEMIARVPKAGGPIAYTRAAFQSPRLSVAIGWALAATAIVSAATITTGFAGYLQSFIDLPHRTVVISLVLVLGGVAAKGMKESAWLMACTTTIGMGALLLVLVAAGSKMVDVLPVAASALASADAAALAGLFGGAILAFYSFIGFGDMAMTAEEVHDVRRTMPRAIAMALGIVAVFYLFTIAAALGVLSASELAASKAPLVAVVRAQGWAGWEVGVPGLFIIVNGALTQTITASRLLLHMGRERSGAPAWLGDVNRRTGTPLRATVCVAAVVLVLALFIPLKTLASVTSLLILVVFASVHASLIVLKRRHQPSDTPDVPSCVPCAGVTLCLLAIWGQCFALLRG